MAKGLLKLNVLSELKLKSLSGKGLMENLAKKYGKKPSPGSIYPLLDSLFTEGLIDYEMEGRQKVYSLTKKGLAEKSCCLKEKEKALKQYADMISRVHPDKKDLLDSFVKNISKKELDPEMGDEFMTFKFQMMRLISSDSYEVNRKELIKVLKSVNRKLEKLE